MSTFYKDGVIAIPEVIGDIVITATAVAQAPAYTNLLDAAIDMDGNVIGHTPMYKNMRYNSSSGAPVANPGTNITGLLPIKMVMSCVFDGKGTLIYHINLSSFSSLTEPKSKSDIYLFPMLEKAMQGLL